MELEFYLKNYTDKSYSNIKINTEAICEWKFNCGKYVMNGTEWQLACYSTVCNQYIASVDCSYVSFRQFFLALYSAQTSYCIN